MSASIWNPGGTVVPTSNADNTLKFELFNATAGQTVFTLTSFQYQPASGSLLVEVNGVAQVLTTDYTETSSTSITFNTGVEVNDQIVIRGYIGGTAAVAAAVSATAALASQTAAAASAVDATTNGAAQVALATAQRILCDADVVICDADVVTCANSVGLAQNYALLANLTDYGAITAGTTFTADYGSV